MARQNDMITYESRGISLEMSLENINKEEKTP